ncbi:MAG: hypothetical protein ACRDPQ_10655 [Nocardioidaceae bacterium]
MKLVVRIPLRGKLGDPGFSARIGSGDHDLLQSLCLGVGSDAVQDRVHLCPSRRGVGVGVPAGGLGDPVGVRGGSTKQRCPDRL